jgi:hypothetical protein
MLRVGALLLAGAVTLTAACGGSKDEDKSSDTSSGETKSSAQVQTKGGKKLTDCEYAETVEQAIANFATNVVQSSSAMVSAAPSGSANEQVSQAFDALDKELAKTIDELKALNLPNDLKKMNDGMILLFEEFRKQVPEMKKAALAGDSAKVTQIVSKTTSDLSPRLEKLAKDNPDVSNRLDKCTAK